MLKVKNDDYRKEALVKIYVSWIVLFNYARRMKLEDNLESSTLSILLNFVRSVLSSPEGNRETVCSSIEE